MGRMWVGALCLGASVTGWAGSPEQAQQLLNYFQSSCQDQGAWTKTALQQTQFMAETVKTLRDNPKCQSLAGSLVQLQFLEKQIRFLDDQQEAKEAYALRRKNNQLLSQLAAGPDPVMEAIIKSELQTTQASIAYYEGLSNSRDAVSAERYGNALSVLASGTEQLVKQYQMSSDCEQRQQILPALASLGATVAATTLSAGAGLVVMAGAQLFGSMVEFFRVSRLNDELETIGRPVVSAAVQCVMTSLSDQWCSGYEAQQIIRLRAQATKLSPAELAPFRGALLVDRELPIFLGWLEKVRAGVDSSSSSEGSRQAIYFEREQVVRSGRAQALGVFNEQSPSILSAQDSDKWRLLRKLILDMARATFAKDRWGNPNPIGPYYEIFSWSEAPYYLFLGRVPSTTENQFRDPNKNLLDFDSNFSPDELGLALPQPDQILQNFLAWHELTEKMVQNEQGRLLQPDPVQVLSDALFADIRGRSPKSTLDQVIRYLDQSADAADSQRLMRQDTISRLQKISDEIQTFMDKAQSLPEGLYRQSLARIFEQSMLSSGTILMGSRIKKLVRLKIQKEVDGLTKDNKESATILLAAQDVLSELSRFGGKNSLDALMMDIQGGLAITRANLRSSTQVFSKMMVDSLEWYLGKTDAERARYRRIGAGKSTEWEKVGEDRPLFSSPELRDQLCLKLLAVEVWPADIPKDLCVGAQLQSIIPGAPPSLKITNEVFSWPMEKRACAYRNFLRSGKIYEDHLRDQGSMFKGRASPSSL